MDEISFFRALYGRVPRTPVTLAIIVLCVAVYAVQTVRAGFVFNMPVGPLRDMGANFAPLVQAGEPWRLVTCIFLHGSPLHIALNMYAFWQLGQIAERLFGHVAFALIFLFTGVAGSLASMWWSPYVVSVGASGAIFGIAGALLAYLFVCRGQMPVSVLRQTRGSMLVFVGYSLFAGAAIPGIDNAAHLGGLAGGLILGAGFAGAVTESLVRLWRRPRAWAALIALVVAAGALWTTAPNVAAEYRKAQVLSIAVASFVAEEKNLIESSSKTMQGLQDGSITPDDAASALRNVARSWQTRAEDLQRVDAPADRAAWKDLLASYADTRAASMRALADWAERGDQRDLDRAQQYERHVQEINARLGQTGAK